MTTTSRFALPFEPYESLGGRPHVMVDGAARESSVLTLSHWPDSPTPACLARDVSAGSVLEYLRAGRGGGRPLPFPSRRPLREALRRGRLAEAVTNDHFDEDGLMSVFALVDPETAERHAGLLVAAATCGDFGVVHSEAAAGVAFAVRPLAEAEAGVASGTSERYLATLPLVAELLEQPERFSRHCSEELGELAAGRAAIEGGEVAVSEDRQLDLAVVARRGRSGRGDRLPGASGGLPVHAAAVHSATQASRILSFDGPFCECYLRYEGWVKMVSRPVWLRPDLAPLAARLSEEEPSGRSWEHDGVGTIVSRLRPGGEGTSELAPSRVLELVRDYLATAEPAWDPWRAGGAHIPLDERRGYGRFAPARPRGGHPRGEGEGRSGEGTMAKS